MTMEERVEEPGGPYHHFWLLTEGEVSYRDYWPWVGRRDAPVHISYAVLAYFSETLEWVPTINPAARLEDGTCRSGHGMNLFGPTVINKDGGALFARICDGWARLFACGPERINLYMGLSTDVDEHGNETTTLNKPCVPRDELIRDLETLADFGRKAAIGEFFILHLGV